MVEYLVVTGMLLTAMMAPVYDGQTAIEALEAAYQDNYEGYSYAVSLSEYPDYLPANELEDAADKAIEDIENLVDFDPSDISVPTSISTPSFCDDWSNFPSC